MNNRAVISNRQFTILVIMNVIGTTILIIPSLLAKEANQDAWLSAILAFVISIPLLLLYLAIHRKQPTKTLVQLFEVVLGKWTGKLFSLLFLMIYPFFMGALTLRNVGDFLTTQIMPETPIEFIHIIFMIVVVYAMKLGLEPIVRAAELLIPIVLVMLFIMFVSIVPQIKSENLFPILDNGFKPVISGAIPFISFPFLENVLFLMILPSVREQDKVGKALFKGVIIGWAILFILILLSILVLGPYITASKVFPSYSLAKKINIAEIFERVEITIAIAWFITSFIRICFYFYCAAAGIAQTLELKEYRNINIPLAMMLIVFSLSAAPNISFLANTDLRTLPFFNLTFGFLLPLGLFIILAVKSRMRK